MIYKSTFYISDIKAKDIFLKTLAFGWIKLGLGLLNIVIAVALFAALMGISVRSVPDLDFRPFGAAAPLCRERK